MALPHRVGFSPSVSDRVVGGLTKRQARMARWKAVRPDEIGHAARCIFAGSPGCIIVVGNKLPTTVIGTVARPYDRLVVVMHPVITAVRAVRT